MKRLQKVLSKFKGKKVFVAGDIMLDHYIYGAVDRISPEAPVPIVLATEDKFFLGGAANVAANVRALGADTDIMGRIGYGDNAGQTIFRLLKDAKIGCRKVFAHEDAQTIEKIRIVSNTGHQLVRIDREHNELLTEGKEAIAIRLGADTISCCDALIISDYDKGFITERLARSLVITALNMKKIIVVDTKPKHFPLFKNVTVIKPNKKEMEEYFGGNEIRNDDDAGEASRFMQRTLHSGVVLTRGADGMTVADGDTVTHLPSIGKEVFDVTGAGDTVTAALVLGLVSGLSLKDAATIANYAAAIVVGKAGTAAVTLEELQRFMT